MKYSVACLVALVAACIEPANAAVYKVKDLGTLGGNASVARDVNNHGQIVGGSLISGSTICWLLNGL